MRAPRPPGASPRKLAMAAGACLLVAVLGPRPRAFSYDLLLTRAATAAGAGRPEAALDWLERALAFEPALASLHVSAAQLALQSGNITALRNHLEAAPPESRTLAAFACMEARLPDDPAAPLLPVPSRCPGGAVSKEGEADEIPSQAELPALAMALQDQLSSAPGDLTGWERFASLTELTRPEGTEAVILQAYRHFPEGSEILDALWRIAHQNDPVLTAAERAAQTGRLLAGQDEWGLAGAAWTRAVELEPAFPQARAYLGLATSKTGGDGLPLLLVASADAPQDPLIRSLLGQYWLSVGDPEAAARELEYAYRLDPQNPAIIAALGAALAQNGRLDEAAQAYREAARTDEQDPAFWILLAEFSLRYDYQVDSLGLEAARNAAALSPNDPAALSALGMADLLAGDAAAAERLLQHVIELDPMDAVGWYRYAMVLLDQGRAEEAQRALTNAATLEPTGFVGQLAQASLANLSAPLQ